eukprot:776081-Pyramimonas_sp.AAC.1
MRLARLRLEPATHEEARCDALVALPHGLHEFYQPNRTHASPDARSRLNGLHCNQGHARYLDYNMSRAAL